VLWWVFRPRVASEHVGFRLVCGPSVVDGPIIAAILIDSVVVVRESLQVIGSVIAASVEFHLRRARNLAIELNLEVHFGGADALDDLLCHVSLC